MEIVLLSCAVTALVVAVVVYLLQARGRQALLERASAAESALAVAQSQSGTLTKELADARTTESALRDEKVALTGERERLKVSVERVEKELQREVVVAFELRSKLDSSIANAGQLESDYRVAKQRAVDLAAQLGDLQSRLQQAENDNRGLTKQVADLGSEVSSLKTARDGLTTRLAEQKTWVEEQTRFFEEKVTTVDREDSWTIVARSFTEVNKKEMDAVVTPFKEQLNEFRQRVDHIYTADTRERGQLQEQIVQLTNLNQTVSRRAEELTNALTISSKATGDWGEMILQKILEDSGLREGKE